MFRKTATGNTFEAFYPDGRWLAFGDAQGGSYEVYVRAFPDNGMQVKISNTGGVWPVWSRNGPDLFYRTEDQHIMVVNYSVKGESFVPGSSNARHRQVNAACRHMHEQGIIKRIKPALEDPEVSASHSPNLASPPFSPDNLLEVKCNMEIVKQKVSEKTVLNEPERLKIVQAHCFSRSLHMI